MVENYTRVYGTVVLPYRDGAGNAIPIVSGTITFKRAYLTNDGQYVVAPDQETRTITNGTFDPVLLHHGKWRVTIRPEGMSYRESFEFVCDDYELDLKDVAYTVISGTDYVRGARGVSVIGARLYDEGHAVFLFSDGTESDPITLPIRPPDTLTLEGDILSLGSGSSVDLSASNMGHLATAAINGLQAGATHVFGKIFTGPGRPDTGVGMDAQQKIDIGSAPVGAEFRSTDGADVGAFVWRKRPDGKWVVIDGDTGWRKIALPVTANTELIADPADRYVHVRRTAVAVHLKVGGQYADFKFTTAVNSVFLRNGYVFLTGSSGLRNYLGGMGVPEKRANSTGNPLMRSSSKEVYDILDKTKVVGYQYSETTTPFLSISSGIGLRVGLTDGPTNEIIDVGTVTYTTKDPWPTTLLGTPL